jgi:hypothetical protein
MRINYTAIGTVVIAFILAAGLVKIAQVLIHRFVGSLEIESNANREAVHGRAKQLIRALTLLLYGIAVLASVSLAFERFGVSEPDWTPRQVLHWFLTHGINVLIVLVGAFIVIRVANLAIEHLQFKLARRYGTTDLEWQRRATTLSGILTRLVASAVRDVISGFFIILEDQVRVGDAARINGVGGSIEQVNLRTIVLRDGDGAVQVFPNGTITSLANLSKQFAYATVDLRVAYNENMDRVFGTAREVGASMSGDPAWSVVLLAPIEVLGIESLADGVATVRVRFKTLPLNQGRVANELRRRLMTTFVGRGIRPFAR